MSQNTVLIVSNTDDQHVAIIHEQLRERSIESIRLDSDTFATKSNSWRIYADVVKSSHSSWFTPGVDVVWYRKVRLQDVAEPVESFVHQETEGLLDSILNNYKECRWVNARDSLARARPKISQLQSAKELGFRIPDTIVTNDIEELKNFAAQHDGKIIAKPIQTQVIESPDCPLVLGTRQLTQEHYVSATKFAPCYAQERLLLNSEIRIVVFGNQLHAFRMTAKQSTDDLKQLELDQIHHEKCSIDGLVSQKIHSLMSFYGLEFGAIDLAVIDDGEPVFLELNPNGQWLWLQYMTGENLIDPFIDFLCFER